MKDLFFGPLYDILRPIKIGDRSVVAGRLR